MVPDFPKIFFMSFNFIFFATKPEVVFIIEYLISGLGEIEKLRRCRSVEIVIS